LRTSRAAAFGTCCSGSMVDHSRLANTIQVHVCVLLSDTMAGDKPGGHHKSRSKSQSHDDVNVHSANESSSQDIKVGGDFDPLQLILMFA